jgi:hypothetical protein
MYTQKGELIYTALFILNVGSNWGGGSLQTLRQLYPQEEGPVTIVEEAGWAPGPVWTVVTGAEESISCVHRVSSPGLFSPVCVYVSICMSINLVTASGDMYVTYCKI